MDEEGNNGFVPVKPAPTVVCSNLFSNVAFEDVNSPMTDLAKSLELSKVKIPRRRLTLTSDSGVPTPERPRTFSDEFTIESGVNSPLNECPDVDSPIIDYIRSKNVDIRRKFASKSFSSPLMARKPLTPLTLFGNHGTSSPFKPVSLECKEENHSELSMCEMADDVPDFPDDFRIKKRSYVARPRSAPTINLDFDMETCRGGEACEDDSFFGDLLKSGGNTMSPSCPSTFLGLVDAPIVPKTNHVEFTEADKENFPPCKVGSPNKHIFQKPTGLPFKKRSTSTSYSVKRTGESPKRLGTKKQKTKCGRSHSFLEGNPALYPIPPMHQLKDSNLPHSPRILQRSQSFDLHNAKSCKFDVTDVDMDDKSLTGDKSKKYLLPTTPSRQPDLKGISCETLAELLDCAYDNEIEERIIVDCRYPYEYDGGHIRGAVNLHDKQGMIDFFLKNPRPSTSEKRRIIIFHCEFSSKRGPGMCRFLRNKDRDVHLYCYPTLYYPEMYLLEGGYKEFYEKKKEYCEPQGYREMADLNFHQELRLFSRRSKSWSEENSLRSRTSLRY